MKAGTSQVVSDTLQFNFLTEQVERAVPSTLPLARISGLGTS